MTKHMPMVVFGNAELDAAPPIAHVYDCPRCKHKHIVEESLPSRTLQFVTCDDGESYVVGVKGKDVTGLVKP